MNSAILPKKRGRRETILAFAVKKGELVFAPGPMLAEWTGLEPVGPPYEAIVIIDISALWRPLESHYLAPNLTPSSGPWVGNSLG